MEQKGWDLEPLPRPDLLHAGASRRSHIVYKRNGEWRIENGMENGDLFTDMMLPGVMLMLPNEDGGEGVENNRYLGTYIIFSNAGYDCDRGRHSFLSFYRGMPDIMVGLSILI